MYMIQKLFINLYLSGGADWTLVSVDVDNPFTLGIAAGADGGAED